MFKKGTCIAVCFNNGLPHDATGFLCLKDINIYKTNDTFTEACHFMWIFFVASLKHCNLYTTSSKNPEDLLDSKLIYFFYNIVWRAGVRKIKCGL